MDYPGGLTSVGDNGGIITISNFSGSDSNFNVSSIVYTHLLKIKKSLKLYLD